MERAMGVGSCTLWWKLEQGTYTLYTKSSSHKKKQLVDFTVPQSTSKALLYPDMETLTREEAWNVNTHEAHILSLYVLVLDTIAW